MNKRQRKYLEKRKAFKRRRNTGYEFTSFTFPAPSPTYDSGMVMPMNDEPDYFKNFAMMMPTKAIKMPTKKELKKQWYDNPRMRRLINISPVLSGMKKPWERTVGGYCCPPPPTEDQTLFGYSLKTLPLKMQFETPELEEKFKNSAFMISYDNEGRPIDSVELKNIL